MKDWKAKAKELYLTGNYTWETLKDAVNKELDTDLTYTKIRTYIRTTDEYKEAHGESKVDNVKPLKGETVTINKDNSQTSECWVEVYKKEKLKDETFLLELHGYDPKDWEIIYAKSTIWQQGYNETYKCGNVETSDHKTANLYSSKITVKRIKGISKEEIQEWFLERLQDKKPVEPRKIIKSDGGLLLFDKTDLHLGQLSWHAESGENYDYKIATKKFKHITHDAISKAPKREYELITCILGNDFFNSDNMQGSTTAGTQQTNDVRPQKMFLKGLDLWIWEIETLRDEYKNTPIKVILVPGNHDTLTSFYLAVTVHAWFRNDPTVEIDITPCLHKGFAYGDTLLLFTHGKRELNNLDWVNREFRKLIAKTKYTEIHAGHGHKILVQEKNGVIVKNNPAIAPLDNWSYEQGYGSISQAITRVYSKEGLEYEIYSRV